MKLLWPVITKGRIRQSYTVGREVVLNNRERKHGERGMPIQSNLRKRASLFGGRERELDGREIHSLLVSM